MSGVWLVVMVGEWCVVGDDGWGVVCGWLVVMVGEWCVDGWW